MTVIDSIKAAASSAYSAPLTASDLLGGKTTPRPTEEKQ